MRITADAARRLARRAAQATENRISVHCDTSMIPHVWHYRVPRGARRWEGSREAAIYALGIVDGIDAVRTPENE